MAFDTALRLGQVLDDVFLKLTSDDIIRDNDLSAKLESLRDELQKANQLVKEIGEYDKLLFSRAKIETQAIAPFELHDILLPESANAQQYELINEHKNIPLTFEEQQVIWGAFGLNNLPTSSLEVFTHFRWTVRRNLWHMQKENKVWLDTCRDFLRIASMAPEILQSLLNKGYIRPVCIGMMDVNHRLSLVKLDNVG